MCHTATAFSNVQLYVHIAPCASPPSVSSPPSSFFLFVFLTGTESSMHVDSGGTNFWLYLLSGKKEWRFFDPWDKINLYGVPTSAHFKMDAFRPDYDKFPLYARATQYHGKLICCL